MFKSFQNTSKSHGFNGFPALNFQMNNEAYGFSGCTFWLDAAYGLNTQTDLAAVSSWQSRIGGITFTQATAGNQPRYILSNASYNNLPTVEGHSNSRYMESIYGIPLKQKWTMITVANYNSLNVLNGIISSLNVAGAISCFMYGGTDTGNNGLSFYQVQPGPGYVFSGTTESTTVKIGIYTNTGVMVNRVQESTVSSVDVNNSLYRIFAANAFTSQTLIGNIAEILIFNYEMTTTQKEIISDRLNSKYAIY